jgi:hypothetical protein
MEATDEENFSSARVKTWFFVFILPSNMATLAPSAQGMVIWYPEGLARKDSPGETCLDIGPRLDEAAMSWTTQSRAGQDKIATSLVRHACRSNCCEHEARTSGRPRTSLRVPAGHSSNRRSQDSMLRSLKAAGNGQWTAGRRGRPHLEFRWHRRGRTAHPLLRVLDALDASLRGGNLHRLRRRPGGSGFVRVEVSCLESWFRHG